MGRAKLEGGRARDSQLKNNPKRNSMRQGQQSRRGRGRGRKTQNPLARNLESNGPDVKIRGTASHIAEKYAGLARDALSSGDTIMAENYLQHAEHYQRIIMAAQAQQSGAAQTDANGAGNQRQQRGSGDGNSRPQASEANEETAAAAPAGENKPADSGSGGQDETAAGGNGAAAEDDAAEGDASPDTASSA